MVIGKVAGFDSPQQLIKLFERSFAMNSLTP